MYPLSGTYNTYPQNVNYGENVAYSRPNYGVTSPTMPYVAGASINYGENVNYHRPNYGITAPTAPNIGNTPVFFGEATNLFRPNYGVVPPAAPNVGGASIVFGEATNANRPTFGITAPVLPAPRTQVNVAPVVPDIPVPQYNVPNRPIHYPPPTTYDAGDYPFPPQANNPITYAPNTYPQVQNTGALQPLPAGGSALFNPYATTIPAEQMAPSGGAVASSSNSELAVVLGATNAMIAEGNQVEQFTQLYAAQEEQMRQQQALQRQQQAVPPDLTQQYYQQSQAISNTYQQGQQQPQSSSSNVDGSSLPAAAKKGISQYGDIIKREAAKNSIPASLLAGLILQESVFNPTAGSGAGAKGLTQLMPGTAKELGVSDVNNPEQSIAGGAKYLGQMFRKYNGNTTLALAAYNAGPGAVDKAGKNVPPYKETQNYVQVVQENEAKFRSAGFA
jgi:soluble lytic murein transglycosylase-like protein